MNFALIERRTRTVPPLQMKILSPFYRCVSLPLPAQSNELITVATAARGRPPIYASRKRRPRATIRATAWRAFAARSGVAGPDFRAGAHSPFNTLFVTPFARPATQTDREAERRCGLQGAAKERGDTGCPSDGQVSHSS